MKLLLPLFLLSVSSSLFATDLTVTNVRLDDSDSTIKATIRWSNAWKNSRNHDAAWVFMKARNRRGQVNHIDLKRITPRVFQSNVPVTMQFPSDSIGVFLYASQLYRGNIEIVIAIETSAESWNALKSLQEVNMYAIEMVYIPEGPFTLGEPGTDYLQYGGLYMSDDKGNPKGLFKINSDDVAIPVGPNDNALYYQANTQSRYEGDQKGLIPPTFPTGYKAFYIMKYEPTQGEYVSFLNTLSGQQSQHRANFGGKGYYQNRGSIRIEDNTYVADHPDRPCNFMSWDDAMAYADWAGLRPLTELEFVKAARGPGAPQKNEYPWNTGSYDRLRRVMKASGDMEKPDEKNLNDGNKEEYGASYYWVMDLAGSMWERVVSIGSEKGRAFLGTHGDGKITGYGFADIDNWPSGVDGSGFGYRGGGYYEYPMDFTEFNPYSPIAYRRFGGWAGGNRTEAYGARFGRTSE